MNDTQATLLTLLNSYGDIVELDWDFDVDNIITQLSSNNNWVTGPSVSAPMGLSLTGSDTLDLRVKDRKEGEYNNNLKSCPSLIEFFDKWNSLAKCHAVKMDAGTFFRPHRDAYKTTQQMRIFIPLNKTELHEWAFIYDKQLAPFKAGRPYLLNTKKQHGSFAFVNDIYHILMGVYINPNNFRVVTDLLPNCRTH
tara:strand:- start:2022 stop:2606 length:585 start_codon:yes stop_codon:yes gene_type:complete